MPKMKTKSAAKKRFSLTGTGKVKSASAYKSHFNRNLTQKRVRNLRGTTVRTAQDAQNVVRFFLPYAK